MVFITSNGDISCAGESNRPHCNQISRGFINLKPHGKVVFLAVVAFVCIRWSNTNPLANGRIPAADLEPHQHWNRILNDNLFVRSMTEHLGATTHRNGTIKQIQEIHEGGERADARLEITLKGIDFGGPDGHILENGDWSDLKYIQGTRCSTTRSAVTAYFCGASVAENQDRGLEESQRKPSNFGVQSFAAFLACRHQQGERRRKNSINGDGNSSTYHTHRRSVYRIAIGCRDPLAGYTHAFSIVAQPDGTYYWLQSFIGHYSLQQWMAPRKWFWTKSSQNAHLSLQELQAKLQKVSRLMNITSWTHQANADYLELFGVDQAKETMRRRKDQWKPSHLLEYFFWDEACEYPLPAAPEDAAPSTDQQSPPHVVDRESKVSDNDSTKPQKPAKREDGATTGDDYDRECDKQMLLSMIQELKEW